MAKRPNTKSEGAMIQRQYINRMLQRRIYPQPQDIGLHDKASFKAGAEWLRAELYKFIATETKRTRKAGGLGR